MNIQEIRDLIQLMDESSLHTLEVSEGNFSLRMERGSVRAPMETVSYSAAPIAAAAPTGTHGKTEKADDIKELKSPMVGTVHLPENSPLLSLSLFKKGDVLCVIEAMKLMNDIVAEEDGEVLWVPVREGDCVEYGQLLLQYR